MNQSIYNAVTELFQEEYAARKIGKTKYFMRTLSGANDRDKDKMMDIRDKHILFDTSKEKTEAVHKRKNRKKNEGYKGGSQEANARSRQKEAEDMKADLKRRVHDRIIRGQRQAMDQAEKEAQDTEHRHIRNKRIGGVTGAAVGAGAGYGISKYATRKMAPGMKRNLIRAGATIGGGAAGYAGGRLIGGKIK